MYTLKYIIIIIIQIIQYIHTIAYRYLHTHACIHCTIVYIFSRQYTTIHIHYNTMPYSILYEHTHCNQVYTIFCTCIKSYSCTSYTVQCSAYIPLRTSHLFNNIILINMILYMFIKHIQCDNR